MGRQPQRTSVEDSKETADLLGFGCEINIVVCKAPIMNELASQRVSSIRQHWRGRMVREYNTDDPVKRLPNRFSPKLLYSTFKRCTMFLVNQMRRAQRGETASRLRRDRCRRCRGERLALGAKGPFGLPEVLVAVSTSRLSCKRVGKTRTLMPVWDSSGESRIRCRMGFPSLQHFQQRDK
jgi:hypothetical protein